MMKAIATTMSPELRALYNVGAAKGLDCWGPVININHDPRWGRNGEAGSEDPLLMGDPVGRWISERVWHEVGVYRWRAWGVSLALFKQ